MTPTSRIKRRQAFLKSLEKKRVCLICDREFLSRQGERRCDSCMRNLEAIEQRAIRQALGEG